MSFVPDSDPVHRFATDRPLERAQEDLLHRKHFSDRLANDIMRWHGGDSLVIGVHGDWGSGKTTLKNFVREAVEKEGKPILVEFNPWMWSGQYKLLEGFFSSLKEAFRQTDNKGQTRDLVSRWESLEALTKFGAEVSDQTGKVLTALFGSSVTAALVLNSAKDPLLRGALITAGVIGIAVGALFAVAPPIMRRFIEWQKVKLGRFDRSLSELRADISEQLQRLRKDKRPVLVIMDDIDRLRAADICLLFQLVKANADFPNLTYLLLFQKNIVEAALEKEFIQGREYLKKIVQVDFDVPHPSREQLEDILKKGTFAILNRDSVRMNWDPDRFSSLFRENLWPYFRTIRDIKRFLSAFDFNFSGHVNRGVLEVNVIDLFVIETLRLFDHATYCAIRDSFGFRGDSAFIRARLKEKRKKTIDLKIEHIVSRPGLDDEQRARLREIITDLFHDDADSTNAERQLRICHPAHFSKYFENSLDESPTSAGAVHALIQLVSDRDGFVARMREMGKPDLAYEVVRKLLIFQKNIPIESFENLAAGLFDVGDELPKSSNDWFSRDPAVEAARVLLFRLKEIPDKRARASMIKKALVASNGVIVPVILTALLDRRGGQKVIDEAEATIDDADRDSIIEAVLPRIRTLAENGKLIHSRHFSKLLFWWQKWSSESEVKAWVVSFATPESKLRFLITFLSESIRNSSQVVPYLDGKSLEDFYDLATLCQEIENASAPGFEEQAVAAKRLLRKAIEFKGRGADYSQVNDLPDPFSG